MLHDQLHRFVTLIIYLLINLLIYLSHTAYQACVNLVDIEISVLRHPNIESPKSIII